MSVIRGNEGAEGEITRKASRLRLEKMVPRRQEETRGDKKRQEETRRDKNTIPSSIQLIVSTLTLALRNSPNNLL